MRPTSRFLLVCLGIALLYLGIGSAPPANAQVGLTAYNFQTVQPHPFVHALGNATVAARGYPGAIGVNPATIGTAGAVRLGSNVNLSRGPLYSSPWIFPEFWVAAPSATLKRGRWAAGVQFKHFDWEDREVRNSEGEVLGTTAFQQSIKGVAAYEVTSALTLGAGMNLIRSRLPFRFGKGVEYHPTVDLGVHYETRIEKDFGVLRPSLGLSLMDVGGNVSYVNRRGDLSAPTTIRGGGALQFTSQSQHFGRPEWRVGLYGALSNLLVSGEFVQGNGGEHFEADGPFTALFQGWGSTYGVATARGERATIGSWERLTKHVGVNVSVLDIFSVRVGRFHESDDNGGRQYTALGFGLNAYYVSLDASWTLGDEDPFQQYSYGRLTVRIPLSNSPRNFWPALLGNDE